jgi:hypothetical protein
MKNYCDICFTCNDTENCILCSQSEICSEFKKCFEHSPYIMWGAMSSFDDIIICVEKWRVYNEQKIKQ